MVLSKLKEPPILGTIVFSAAALSVTSLLIFVGWQLYITAGKPTADFYAKLGELALQLAVVVIVGAFVKAVVDWGISQRMRHTEKLEARKEFMKRIRAVHVSIQNARDLMNAHRSPKTWGEQSRRLMELRPEIEEISEDLKASKNLFEKEQEIIDGLEGIISYLKKAGEEYVKCHDAVRGGNLVQTIEEQNMMWVRDFMAEGEDYLSGYAANLTKSKGAMRSDIYGG